MVWRKPRAVSSASDPSVPLTAQVPRPEVVEERKKNETKKMAEDGSVYELVCGLAPL